ncbi:hypothetical protein DPMN_004035 [Dreissena polymorpha]|uniref:Uncharacterized protein n=1 Tax=Dreissena polymorpha TaxID=45954 RepID=A0A9D4MRW5_DREPO|nr:hypothetical protein DPMN_004035 [Dreissena polymorpha]
MNIFSLKDINFDYILSIENTSYKTKNGAAANEADTYPHAACLTQGRPRIDRIVIREVQYQFEVNRCRNEEIIVKSNFGWAWPMWAGRPRIDRIVIREIQYQFEDNRCRNEEIIFQVSRMDGRRR